VPGINIGHLVIIVTGDEKETRTRGRESDENSKFVGGKQNGKSIGLKKKESRVNRSCSSEPTDGLRFWT
jgi:hypothetical protein